MQSKVSCRGKWRGGPFIVQVQGTDLGNATVIVLRNKDETKVGILWMGGFATLATS